MEEVSGFNWRKSLLKGCENGVKLLKYYILFFCRRFYGSQVKYADEIVDRWLNGLVVWLVDVFLHGFVIYLVLSGVLFVVPKSEGILFLGTRYWQVPVVMFYLGIMYWFFRSFWLFVREGKLK